MTLEELAIKANTEEFNKLKLLEEFHECGELLVKTLTKPKHLHDISHLIEELGDVIVRANIVAEILGRDKVNARIASKTDTLTKHYINKINNKTNEK